MTKRIFRSICLVSLAVFLLSTVLLMGSLYRYFSSGQKEQLRAQALLAAQAIEHEGIAYFDGLGAADAADRPLTDESRVTWISSEGIVLADTAAAAGMTEQPLGHEEIRKALEMGIGESVWHSDTWTERNICAVARLSDGSVVRVSTIRLSLFGLMMSMIPQIALLLALTLLLAFLLALRQSRRLLKPLNELQLDELPERLTAEYEELTPLLNRLSVQQTQLRLHDAELRRRQDEFRVVTDGLADGLILLNEQQTVISANAAAARLIPPPPDLRRRTKRPWIEGRPLETISDEFGLSALLDTTRRVGKGETTVTLNNMTYRLHADPVVSDGGVVGYVVLIVNITEQVQAEQLRREFTANVSHELKTPLHTIAGCSELLADGMVRPEDIPAFAGQIHTESLRMIRLVDDIIGLSHLDEGAADLPRTTVDMTDIARRATAAFAPMAEAAEVTLRFEGDEPFYIEGISGQLEAIVSNLCSNAVKYNRRGGRVTVAVSAPSTQSPSHMEKEASPRVCLSVSDTGIGIPEEHLDRIFERFYRVDKSHSKAVGGTGLGLSIVKHAVRLHGGTIEVNSRVGEGTTVRVWFV